MFVKTSQEYHAVDMLNRLVATVLMISMQEPPVLLVAIFVRLSERNFKCLVFFQSSILPMGNFLNKPIYISSSNLLTFEMKPEGKYYIILLQKECL